MVSEWNQLTELSKHKPFVVTGVKLKGEDIAINGAFELPPLARLAFEDQVFVGEFIRSHGSIKHMEKAFGVSYPTIKGRLNKISEQLNLVELQPPSDRQEILDQLERGDINAKEALERLQP